MRKNEINRLLSQLSIQAAQYNNSGLDKFNAGRYEEAIKDFDAAIRLNGQDGAVYFNRGVVQTKLGRYEEAIKDFDVVIQRIPSNATFYKERAVAKVGLGRYEEALKDLDTAIRLNAQQDGALYFSRGMVQTKLERYEEAIKDFDAAIKLDPKNASYYHFRGLAKDKVGRYEEAIEDFDKVIQLNPNFDNALKNRDELKLKQARLKIPDDYQCPITLQLMYKPVIAADGESYEEEIITAWLINRDISPKNGGPLTHKNLISNKNLQRVINELLEKYPILKASGEYYLPISLRREAINAVKSNNTEALKALLKEHFALVQENLLADIPLPNFQLETQAQKQTCEKLFEKEYELEKQAQPVTSPFYLMQCICEYGNAESLKITIECMGPSFKTILLKQTKLDDLFQMLAKRQEKSGIEILATALKYQSEDYSRLMQLNLDAPVMFSLWLDYYLQSHKEAPEVVLQSMITKKTIQEAIAVLKATSIPLDSNNILAPLAIRCIKEALLAELQLLVTMGLSLQTVDTEGNSLLHLAAVHNQKTIALWLLNNGCSEKIINKQGQRPRQVATAHQHNELADILMRQHQLQKLTFFTQPLQERINELERKLIVTQSQLTELKNTIPSAASPSVTKDTEPENVTASQLLLN